MKHTLPLVLILGLMAPAGAKEPQKKTRSTVPGPYPSIIKIEPARGADQEVSKRIIQSELGGREMQFLQVANRTGNEQSALIELAKTKGASDQVKAVAEALSSTLAAESKEVGRIAKTKDVMLSPVGPTFSEELSPLSGAKFEKAWIERLMAVNESAVTAYELGAKAEDVEIRSFAEKMLPVAQARLQMANRLGGRSIAPKAGSSSAPDASTPNRPQPIAPPIEPSKPRATR